MGILVVGSTLLLPSTPPAFAQTTFVPTDLDGTWRSYAMVTPTRNTPGQTGGFAVGTLTFANGGLLTSGSLTLQNGTMVPLTPGTQTPGTVMTITASGVVTGNLVSQNPFIVRKVIGSMDASKTRIEGLVTIRNEDGVETRLGTTTFVKQTTTMFSPQDLEGTWRIYSLFTPANLEVPVSLWSFGTVTVASSGTVTGSLTLPSGQAVPFNGGSFNMSANGDITGTLTQTGAQGSPITITISASILPSTNQIAGVFTITAFDIPLVFGRATLIKQTTTMFQQADLDTGSTWRVLGFVAGTPGGDSGGWGIGPIKFNDAGTVTGGSLTFNDGDSGPWSGGSLAMNASGVLTGTLQLLSEPDEPAESLSIDNAAMLPTKDGLFGVFSSQNEFGFLTMVKEEPGAMPSLGVVIGRRGGSMVTSTNQQEINCGPDCAEAYPSGTSRSLTATLGPGRTFLRWGGCNTATGLTCDVTLTGTRFVGARFGPNFQLQFIFSFPNGSFGSNNVGIIGFPASVTGYSAFFQVEDAPPLPAAAAIGLTGPPGSDYSNTPAVCCDPDPQEANQFYSFPFRSKVIPPGGQYTVNYRGQDRFFTMPNPNPADPQGTTPSLPDPQVIPVPTVTINADKLEKIDWVYKDTNGNTISPPLYLTQIQICVSGGTGGCFYFAESISPGTTSHTLTQTVNWSDVNGIQIFYNDTLNNRYQTFWDKQPVFTLTVDLQGDGSGTVTSLPLGIDCGGLGTDCDQSYRQDTPVDLFHSEDTGTTFVGFTGDPDCSDGQVTMNADKTCTANFDGPPTRLLKVIRIGTGSGTVTSDPPGIDCGLNCEEAYPVAAEVKLMAVADPGSIFVRFGGNPGCTGGTVTMDSNRTCTAQFDLPCTDCTLTIMKQGTGSGTVTSDPAHPGINCGADCTQIYATGTVPMLSAVPNLSTFDGFSGHPDCADGMVTMDANKTCSATFTASQLADLAVTTVLGPPTGASGQTVSIANTVRNQGTGSAVAFDVKLYLSPDDSITINDTLLVTQSVKSLKAGASSAATTKVTIPSDLAPGMYFLGVVADTGGTVAELDETNNIGVGLTEITVVRPDLLISGLSGPADAARGQTVAIANTVQNQSQASAGAFEVGLYLSSDNTVDLLSDTLLATRPVSSLKAGASSAASTKWTIPDTAPLGPGFLCAFADRNDAVPETNETNNARCVPVNLTTELKPDLTMSALVGPGAAAAGVPVIVTNTVLNEGTSAAAEFNVRLYFSSNDTAEPGADQEIGSRTVKSLKAGASSAAATSVMIPNGTPLGSAFLCAVADQPPVLPELDETNNARCTPIQITTDSKPDLVVTAVSGPTSTPAGKAVSVANAVRNQGTGAAGAFVVGLFLSPDSTITGGGNDIPLTPTRSVTSLTVGGSSAATSKVLIPATTPPGLYFLGAIADFGSPIPVPELDETNNAGAAPTPIVVGQPDLVISTISGPATAATNTSVSIANTVRNQGMGDAGAFTVQLYLSTDAVITEQDIPLLTRSVSSLKAGASSAVTTKVTIPNSVAPGLYFIGAKADAGSAVPELDESNNTGATILPILITPPLPDLIITTASGPTTAMRGQPFNVSGAVKNQGPTAAPAFQVGVYLSTDNIITTADRLLKTQQVPGLAAGASQSGTISDVPIPADVISGSYFLGLIADDVNAIPESNESNNAKAGSKAIQIQ